MFSIKEKDKLQLASTYSLKVKNLKSASHFYTITVEKKVSIRLDMNIIANKLHE